MAGKIFVVERRVWLVLKCLLVVYLPRGDVLVVAVRLVGVGVVLVVIKGLLLTFEFLGTLVGEIFLLTKTYILICFKTFVVWLFDLLPAIL